jgi:hypothetical protein
VNFSERTRAMENELKRKTSGNISSEQKTILTDFMGAHPELGKRKFNSEFNQKKKAQELWELLTIQLNQVNGASKE